MGRPKKNVQNEETSEEVVEETSSEETTEVLAAPAPVMPVGYDPDLPDNKQREFR